MGSCEVLVMAGASCQSVRVIRGVVVVRRGVGVAATGRKMGRDDLWWCFGRGGRGSLTRVMWGVGAPGGGGAVARAVADRVEEPGVKLISWGERAMMQEPTAVPRTKRDTAAAVMPAVMWRSER